MFSRLAIIILLFVSLTSHAQQLSDYEKANTAFNNGLIDESYIHLKNSLNNDPEHLPSKILMGQVLGLSGYFYEAELELKEVLARGGDANLVIEPLMSVLLTLKQYQEITDFSEQQLSPAKKALLLSTKGIAFNKLGKQQSAIKSFEAAIKVAPTSIVAINAYANYLITRGEFANAQTLIEDSVAINPNVPGTYILQAGIFKAKNQTSNEIASLYQTLALAPSHPIGLRELAAALSKENRYEEAKSVLEKTLALTPNDPIGQLLLGWVASKLNDDALTEKTLSTLVNNLSLIDSAALSNNEELLYVAGMANYANNNLEAAKQSLNQYLFKRPENIQAATILVDIYKAEGNYTGAIGILERFESTLEDDLPSAMNLCELYIAAKLNHKCAWLLTRLESKYAKNDSYIEMSARLLAARGKLDLALGKLDEIGSGNLSTLLQKAILSIRSEQYTEANQHIDALLKDLPDSPGIQNLKAAVLSKTNRGTEANALYRSIIKEHPGHFEASFNLANKLFSEGRSNEAFTYAETLYSERPDSVEVLILYGRILVQLGRKEQALGILQNANARAPKNIDIKEALIDLNITNGNNFNALTIINTLIKDDFLNPEYLYKRGLIYTNLNELTKAKEDFKTLAGIYSDSASDLYRLSLAQARISDTQSSLNTINRILELDETNFFAKRDSVRMLLALGNIDEATTRLDSLNKRYPKNPDVDLLMGDLYLSKDNFEAAAARYVTAVRSQSSLAPALIKSYQLAIEGHGEDGFIMAFEGLARDYERNTFSTNLLADYYLTIGNNEKAKPLYLSLSNATDYVGRPLVLNNLANLYIQEDKIDAAYNFAQQAYEALPNNQAILDTLGWILTLRGNHDNALNLLRESFSMNASDPGLRYHLAYTLMKLGRNSEALNEVNILLSEFAEFDYRQDAEALKNQLSGL